MNTSSRFRSRSAASFIGLLIGCTALIAQGVPNHEGDESQHEIDTILDRAPAAVAAGNYPEVARLGAEALRLSEAAGDRRRIVRALLVVGSAHYYQSRYLEALTELRRAEAGAADLADISGEKQAKRLIGNTQRQMGRFDEALHTFQDWFRLNRHAERPEPEGPMVLTLGILYREMGDAEKAERTHREALKQARASWNRPFEARALLGLGALMKDRNRYPGAIRLHRQALRLAEAVGARDLQAEILNSLGDAYRHVGDTDQAATSLNTARRLAQALGYRGLEAQTTERLGEIEFLRGHGEAAVQSFARAESIYRETGVFSDKRVNVQLLWAQANRSLGRFDEALANYREAIRVLEQMERITVSTEMARALPMAAGRAAFEEAVDLLVELGRPAEAFDLAERGRARAFLDVLNDSQIDLRSTLTPDERGRETELLQALAASRSADTEADALAALEVFYVDLRRSNPAYANLKRPELATVERARRDLTDSRTIFIEYLIADKRSYAWAITPDGVRLAILPPRMSIERRARAYRASLTDSVTALTKEASRRRTDDQARAMYRVLLGPFEQAIRRAPRLLVAADGALDYLPFETLIASDGHLLIERTAVSYSQSASATLELRALTAGAPAPSRRLLAIGDANYSLAPTGPASGRNAANRPGAWTQLPSTRDEVLGIAGLYAPGQRRVYLGRDATDASLTREDLRDYRFLHFAVHGLVDDDHPARSGLVLSRDPRAHDDGILRMGQIARLRANADVVTLSACRTGAGRLLTGEGLMALSRAFLYAGAHTVVASLWDVNDQSTAALMKRFYRELNAGLRPDDALRRAKLGLLQGHPDLWRDPHFWAPFVVLQ